MAIKGFFQTDTVECQQAMSFRGMKNGCQLPCNVT